MAANLIYMTKTAWQSLLNSIKTKAGYVGTLTASQAKTVVDNIQTGGGGSISIDDASYLFNANTRLNIISDLVPLVHATKWYSAFYSLTQSGHENIDLSTADFSAVNDVQNMFSQASGVKSVVFPSTPPSNVVNANSMFNGASKLETVNLNGWKFNNMSSMFYNTGSNGTAATSISLSGVDTSSCSSFYSTFNGMKKVQKIDISSFEIKQTTSCTSMFKSCTALEEVVYGDTPSVGYVSGIVRNYPFIGCTALRTIRLKGCTQVPTMPTANYLATADDGTTVLQHIYVPAALVNDFKSATNWTLYADIIEADPEE